MHRHFARNFSRKSPFKFYVAVAPYFRTGRNAEPLSWPPDFYSICLDCADARAESSAKRRLEKKAVAV